MIYISKYLVPKGYNGLTVFPFVFLKYAHLKTNNVLLNHEKIHLIQQMETLILPFFVWYGVEFLIKLTYYKNWHLAYSHISFEREAYANESDLIYLKKRPFWNFINYMIKDSV